MAFRWKNFPTPEQNKAAYLAEQGMEGFVPNGSGYATAYNVDPGLMASQNMQGYNPNNVYNGRTPVAAGGDGAGYQFDSTGIDTYMAGQQNRQQIQAKINELETELASITSKIAEIDKATPGLAKNPREWEIAAKRAEIGDMSAYDNLVSRGNQSSSSVSNIESGLYAAAKELWGMKDADDSQRNMSQNIIGVELQKAEEWARKNGVNIETGMPRIYYDLRQKYNELGGNGAPASAPAPVVGGARLNFENARTIGNEVASLVAKKDLHDSDINDMNAWVSANPNSPHSSEIRTLIKDNKDKTEEAKARSKKTKSDSDALYNQAKDLSKDGLVKWWEGLNSKQRELFKKHHSIDLAKGTVQ